MHTWIKKNMIPMVWPSMALLFLGLVACQEPPPSQEVKPFQAVVSMKIPPPPPLPGLDSKLRIAAASSPSPPETKQSHHLTSKAKFSPASAFALEPYSPTGKINPFIPLVQTHSRKTARMEKVEKKPISMLTPLEKFDLSQIRLVAVVLAESGKIAMVEEPSGKGYLVRVGTYIGKNSGTVVQILTDRIVIDETITDLSGGAVSRTREMKLNKQEAEG